MTGLINESGKCYRIMKRLDLLELVGRWMLSVVQMPGPHDLKDARVRRAMPIVFQSGILPVKCVITARKYNILL